MSMKAVVKVSRSLTEFQRSCEHELSSAIAAKKLALANRALAGESETYICASVRGTDIVVYIYTDEAQFHRSGKVAGRYEHQDFRSPDGLQKGFISGVLEAKRES